MSSGRPTVSVLINSCNYARFLPEAIDSALRQDPPAVDVVVVDDASTDASVDIIRSYGAAITPVLLDENGGQANGVNHGAPVCRGDVVAMLDADDAFRPGKIAAVQALAAAHPEAAVIMDRCQEIDATGRFVGSPIPAHIPAGDLADAAARQGGLWNCPPMSGLSFRASFLARVLPEPAYPHRVSFDHHLANVAALTAPVAATDEAYTLRRLHGGNKYKHEARRRREDWTLREDMARTERLVFQINQTLERLGNPRRLDVEDKSWYRLVSYWAGDMTDLEFARWWMSRGPEARFIPKLQRLRASLATGRRLRRRRAGRRG